MTRYWRRYGFQLTIASAVLVGGAIAYKGDCAVAQIAPDGTLLNNSIVTPSSNTSLIEGGTQAGSNLFHSFEQFSIPTGGAAHFNNGLDVQNIFSRVTGKSISNIDGLIRANGTANLFLLNPNGIIFGPNAQLDIGGSFLGSTASSLNFADGTQFSTTAPQTPPLLTVSVPTGLQYGGNPGSILNQSKWVNNGGSLQVQSGKILALVGGDVKLDGRNLQAPGGRVELGGLAGAGTVGLNIDGNNLRLNFPDSVARANVSLTNGADVNVRAGGGGSIVINARNLNLAGGSRLRAGIDSGLGSTGSVAGDVEINATGLINLTNESFIANAVQGRAVGNGGDIKITTRSLSVTNGARVLTSSAGRGAAGNIEVAADTIRLNNKAALSADTLAGQSNIFLRSGYLVLRHGSNITTNAAGTARGGNITIDTDILAALENSDISANAQESFGGQVIIDAQGIFGTQFRNQPTKESDITTTSIFMVSGTIEINSPDVAPLSAEIVDVSGLIASSCAAIGENKFIVTGRGGLPPSPNEVLSSDAVWVDWGTLNPKVENSSSPPVSTNQTATEPAPIVEARGWVINNKGEVMLTANAPTTTPHSPWITSATCHTPQASS